MMALPTTNNFRLRAIYKNGVSPPQQLQLNKKIDLINRQENLVKIISLLSFKTRI